MPRTPGKMTSLWAQIGFYTSLGFILPAGAFVGFLIGYWLDKHLHTSTILAVVLAFLGAAAGLIEILRVLMRADRDAGGSDSNGGPGAS